LQPIGLGPAAYLESLTDVVTSVLLDFDLGKLVRTDPLGVRLGDDRVASLGVAVRRWIAYHGFTLNIGPFLAPYSLVREPGPTPAARATSMEARRQRPTSPARVRESVVRHVEQVFGLERSAIFTSHPILQRTPFLHVHARCSS
jgi:lipoyl(octanoyl) transferase